MKYNYQRQTSSTLLSSLPINIEEKRAMRKVGLFTEAQLMKYRKWFDAMDTDKSGTVNIEELSTVLLSSGVLKYKYEVENMYRLADIDKSGEISFEEFVSGIGSTIASGKLQLHKLDELVDETNVLSAETMLSQARREILMEHIIHNSSQRAAEIERASIRIDEERNRTKSRRRQHIIAFTDIKKHKTLENLVQQHQLTRMKSMHTISQLSQVLSAEMTKSKDSPKKGYYGDDNDTIDLDKSLVPLESLLDPSLWSLIDPSLRSNTNDDYSFPNSRQNTLLQPIESPPPKLCDAAFQSPLDSLSFLPRTKVILRRIGSTENVMNTARDKDKNNDEDDNNNNDNDDNNSVNFFDGDSDFDTRSQKSVLFKKQSSSTVLLKPIKKKKISKLHLRKLENSGNDQPITISSTVSISKPSDFYMSLQNRFSKRRNELNP